MRARDPSGSEVKVLRSRYGSGIRGRLLHTTMVAQRTHVYSEASETAEDNKHDCCGDDSLAGLFVHFHSDLQLEEQMPDGLQNKRLRRETR